MFLFPQIYNLSWNELHTENTAILVSTVFIKNECLNIFFFSFCMSNVVDNMFRCLLTLSSPQDVANVIKTKSGLEKTLNFFSYMSEKTEKSSQK